MFRASSCPSSGVTTSAVAASGLLSEFGDSSAVGRGWVGYIYFTHVIVACKVQGLLHTCLPILFNTK
jgi:hypothetical protein